LNIENYTPCTQYLVVIGIEKCECNSGELGYAISPLIENYSSYFSTNPTIL